MSKTIYRHVHFLSDRKSEKCGSVAEVVQWGREIEGGRKCGERATLLCAFYGSLARAAFIIFDWIPNFPLHYCSLIFHISCVFTLQPFPHAGHFLVSSDSSCSWFLSFFPTTAYFSCLPQLDLSMTNIFSIHLTVLQYHYRSDSQSKSISGPLFERSITELQPYPAKSDHTHDLKCGRCRLEILNDSCSLHFIVLNTRNDEWRKAGNGFRFH